MKKYQTPAYIYDLNTITERCKEIKESFPEANLYYACKANTNPEIIKHIYSQGFGIETVSPGEIKIAKKAGVPINKITYTCGSINETELFSVAKEGILMHLDSLHQVELIGKKFPGKEISVRLNLHVGAGHHSHVITSGSDSKFGIDVSHIKELKRTAEKYNLKITGLHQHIGSNVLKVSDFMKGVQAMLKISKEFPSLKHIEFGGGFGVPYNPKDKRLDIKKLGIEFKKATKFLDKTIKISFEPGRYLVAEAGELLVTVTDIKRNPKKTFVGVNSGMNHLIRPAMYDSHHEIVNISNPKGKKIKVNIVGNICESGDFFAKDRMLASPSIGDTLSIKNAGAYGYSMSSEYNSREKPKEYLT